MKQNELRGIFIKINTFSQYFMATLNQKKNVGKLPAWWQYWKYCSSAEKQFSEECDKKFFRYQVSLS